MTHLAGPQASGWREIAGNSVIIPMGKIPALCSVHLRVVGSGSRHWVGLIEVSVDASGQVKTSEVAVSKGGALIGATTAYQVGVWWWLRITLNVAAVGAVRWDTL